jgi:hypothetical protein
MATKKSTKPALSSQHGFDSPIVAADGGVKVSAWLDTDKPRATPRYHVVVRQRGGIEHDFFALTPDRIKALGEQFLALHSQLALPAEPGLEA